MLSLFPLFSCHTGSSRNKPALIPRVFKNLQISLMVSTRELDKHIVACGRVNSLGPLALLAVFREMRCRLKASVDYPPALLFPSTSTWLPAHGASFIKCRYSPTSLCLSVHLRCAESVHPHPDGHRTERRQPLVVRLPSAVQQQLQDLRCPTDLHR